MGGLTVWRFLAKCHAPWVFHSIGYCYWNDCRFYCVFLTPDTFLQGPPISSQPWSVHSSLGTIPSSRLHIPFSPGPGGT